MKLKKMILLSGMTVLLLLAGIVYLIEALSDIIQVAYYKKTKKQVYTMLRPKVSIWDVKGDKIRIGKNTWIPIECFV